MKTLATILPINTMIQHCKQFSSYLWGRWDVLHGDQTTRDLDDRRAILPITEDRRSKISQILPNEMMDMGAYNPSLVVMVSLLPLLAVLTSFGWTMDNRWLKLSAFIGAGFPSFVLVILTAIVMRSCRERVLNIASAIGIGYVLPLTGLLMSKMGVGLDAGAMQRFSTALMVLGGLLAVLGIVSFISARAREPLGLAFRFVIYAVGGIVVSGAIHPVLIFPTCLVLGSFASIQMVKRWDKERAAKMIAGSNRFGGESNGLLLTSHIPARHDQARRCKADTTPLFFIGRSQAELYERGDVFAADRDLPILASVDDLSQHLVIFGKTGKGKTVFILNRLQTQCIAMRKGGMIYIDPKSDGALKFKHLPNYTVIRPTVRDRLSGAVIDQGVNINLIEGIEVGKVTETLASVAGCVNNTDKGGNGNAQYFIDGAKIVGYHAEVLLFWSIETYKYQNSLNNETGKKIPWARNMAGLRKMYNYIAQYDHKNRAMSMITPIVDYIYDHGPAAGRNETLNATIEWVRNELPKLVVSEETWSSIISTGQQFFSHIMNDADLISWANCAESEVDIGQAFYGQCFGIHLPIRHGTAGEMAMALIRYRLNQIVRSRSDDWREKDPLATPVWLIIDEAQEVINAQDAKILSMGRSVGLYMWLATQSEAALRAKLNEVMTESVLNNLLSFVALDIDHQTFEVIQEKIGKCRRKKKSGFTPAIDFEQNAHLIANSPVFDRTHPGAGRYWDHLGALGAGLPVPDRYTMRNPMTGRSYGASYEESMDFFSDQNLFPEMIVGEGGEEQFILEDADFNVLKSGQGSALVSINRGGEARRDMVKLTPFPIPSLEEFQHMQDYFNRTGMWPEEALSMKNPDESARFTTTNRSAV